MSKTEDARWLSSEDALPEPGEKAFVYTLAFDEQTLIFRTVDALASSIQSDLEGMSIGQSAVIGIKVMTAEELGGLPEFEGW